jgi:hypothetical protein
VLQILLAFLAISIVSVTGYGLIEQLSLQQIMLDQRENARRLDVAAEAIQARLVTIPGYDGVYAPAPYNASSGWSYLPVGIGGIKTTTDAVPFLYCPIAPTAGNGTDQVKMSDGSSYGIEVKAGVVVGSELGSSSMPLKSTMAAYQPAAYIIAANRGGTQPPKCSDVSERNGRPFVNGGYVRVVGRPSAQQVAGTIAASASDVYVSSAGTGNGRFERDATSFDDALRQWIKFRPAAMTIHIIPGESVTVTDAALWNTFAGSLASSPSRLVIEGNGASISAPAGQVGISANLALSGGDNGMTLSGPTLIVQQGDELNTRGNVLLNPATGGSGVYVQQGGRLNVSNGTLRIGGAAANGVESAGDVAISGGAIAASGKSWSLGLTNGGRLSANSSTIGDVSQRNQTAGLAVAGTWSVSSDAASRVAAAGNGICWATLDGNDATFSFSDNGAGASSAVRADPIYPGTIDPSSQEEVEAYQAYRREIDGRQRARQTNHSNFTCV